jgi:dTDP-4-dehydrorhamnose 3,5-epimerase-like enzyme
MTLNFRIIKEFSINKNTDERGNLYFSEFEELELFQIKRLYYLTEVGPNQTRGAHAHKSLKQIFFVLQGSFTLEVSDGEQNDKVKVNDQRKGYYVPQGVWRELSEFSRDCICLVLVSDKYEPSDYISDFSEFQKWKKSL